MTYKKFLSLYAKTHSVTYAQAMKDCAGPEGVWSKFKSENNIQPKPRVRKPKGEVKKRVPKEKLTDHPAEVDVVPDVKAKPKPKPKAAKRKVVKVQAPPKGKKMVVSYVSESDSEEEVELVEPDLEDNSDDE